MCAVQLRRVQCDASLYHAHHVSGMRWVVSYYAAPHLKLFSVSLTHDLQKECRYGVNGRRGSSCPFFFHVLRTSRPFVLLCMVSPLGTRTSKQSDAHQSNVAAY